VVKDERQNGGGGTLAYPNTVGRRRSGCGVVLEKWGGRIGTPDKNPEDSSG